MIYELLRYYWQVLKDGKPIPIKEKNPIYGREELSSNQHWYGFTALALVAGLVISISLLAYCSIDKRKVDKTIHCTFYSTFYCPYFPTPQKNDVHAKGELALGTKVSFIDFPIPKPAPRKEIIERGIRKDIKIRDPKGEVIRDIWTCDVHFPDSIESQLQALDLALFSFGFPEIKEGSDWHDGHACSGYYDMHMYEMCQPEPLHDYSLEYPVFEEKVDERPIPVNLDEVRKLIGYPQILQDAGIVGGHEIQVMVSKEGIYESHTTERELHPIMTEQIAKHIDKLIFTPAIREGNPVAHYVKIPFRFCVIN